MRFFELGGTIYRITLNPGTSWKDTSADTIHRWIPGDWFDSALSISGDWFDSALSVSHVRSFGTPTTEPN